VLDYADATDVLELVDLLLQLSVQKVLPTLLLQCPLDLEGGLIPHLEDGSEEVLQLEQVAYQDIRQDSLLPIFFHVDLPQVLEHIVHAQGALQLRVRQRGSVGESSQLH